MFRFVTQFGIGFAALAALVFVGARMLAEEGEVQGVQTGSSSGEFTEEAQHAGITDAELDAIIITAERFAERFGTFTNTENFQNFQNLKPYATSSMQDWMDNFVREQENAFIDQELVFYGISTKALVSTVLESRPERIELLINTEREEITDQSETAEKTYQNILVEMEQVDDDWKVNYAQFQET